MSCLADQLIDLFGSIGKFDPESGEGRWRPVGELVSELRRYLDGGAEPIPFSPTLWAHQYVFEALASIMAEPRQKQVRTTTLLPVHRVRDLDTRCMAWLAKQPGRTLREKTARGRTRAVVRPLSADLPENRVARQLCRYFAAAARRELHVGHATGGHTLNPERQRALERWERLGKRDLAASALAALGPAAQVTPNNVLLRDPRYRRIWRAWQLWHQSELWGQRPKPGRGERGLLHALGWAAAAAAAECPDLTFAEGVACPQPWPWARGRSWCVERDLGAADTLVQWYRADGELGPTVTRLRVHESSLALVLEEMTLRNWDDPGASEPGRTVRVIIDIVEDRDGGAPVVALSSTDVVDESVGDVGAAYAEIIEEVTPPGLARLGAWILDASKALRRRPGTVPGVQQPQLFPTHRTAYLQRWLAAGWDCTGAQLSVASGGSLRGRLGVPLQAVALEVPGGGCEWLAGTAATRVPASPAIRRYTMGGAWARIEHASAFAPGATEHLTAVRRMLTEGATGRASPYPGARLAITMPDHLNEAQVATFHALLPTNVARKTMVWRSVAAALAYRARGHVHTEAHGRIQAGEVPNRAEGHIAVEVGDRLLVIDLDSPMATATLLDAQHDELDSADPFVWERLPGEGFGDVARACTARRLELEIAEELIGTVTTPQAVPDETAALSTDVCTRLAEVLVDEGWMDPERLTPQECWLPVTSGERGENLRVWLDPEQLGTRLAARLAVRLPALLQRLTTSTTGQLFRAGTSRSRRVLVVSRLFRFPAVCDAALTVCRSWDSDMTWALDGDPALGAWGAAVFLERDAAGLPTWRDRLPDLYLDVRSGERVQIFSASSVAPGQLIELDAGRFQLPAGPHLRAYDFPLTREQRGGQPLPQRLWLESSTFPLARPIVVQLRVAFRYAENAFTIYVTPFEEAPFGTLALHWTADGGDAQDRRLNEPPQIPPRQPWSAVPETIWAAFQSRAYALRAAFEVAQEGQTTQALKQPRNPEPVQRLEAIRAALDDVQELCRVALWTANRECVPPPPAAQTTLDQDLIPVLWRLAGLEEARRPNSGGRRQPKGWSRGWKDARQQRGDLKPDVQRLERAGLNLLASLRGAAPRAYVEALLDERATRRDTEPLLLLARVLGDCVAPAAHAALDWMLDALADACGRDQARLVRNPLWALSTVLWGDPEAVHQLDGARLGRLLDLVHHVLQHLREGWIDEPAAPELFHLLGNVLFAVLRLRGQPVGAAVRAGTDALDALAEAVASVDHALLRRGAERTGRFARTRLDLLEDLPPHPEYQPGQLSPFGHALWATLRGEWNARIIAVEED